MRPERTPRTLEQIKDSVSFVLTVLDGKTLADYSGDRLLRQAVERNLDILGEAVGRLRRDDPDPAFHPECVGELRSLSLRPAKA